MFIQKWIYKNILKKNKSLNNPKVLSNDFFYESKKESEDLTIIKYDQKQDIEQIMISGYINSNKVQNINKIITNVPIATSVYVMNTRLNAQDKRIFKNNVKQ